MFLYILRLIASYDGSTNLLGFYMAHPAVETEGDVAALVAAEAELSWVGERSPPLPIGVDVWWTWMDKRAVLKICSVFKVAFSKAWTRS